MCCLTLLSADSHREQVAVQASGFPLEHNLGSDANGAGPSASTEETCADGTSSTVWYVTKPKPLSPFVCPASKLTADQR